MTERWRITLLGGFAVQRGQTTITRFRTQKFGALLAFLAYHLRQAHPREVLVDMRWPAGGLIGRAGRPGRRALPCPPRSRSRSAPGRGAAARHSASRRLRTAWRGVKAVQGAGAAAGGGAWRGAFRSSAGIGAQDRA